MKKISILFIVIIATFSFLACKNENDSVVKRSSLSGQSLQSNYIKWNGRTEQKDNQVFFYHTASGFEVRFFGTELVAEFTTDNRTILNKYTQISVAVDNVDILDGNVIELSKSLETITLAKDLENGEHSIKITKMSEPSDSSNSLKSLTTDGYFLSAPSLKNNKFLIIGGSGISGHGALGSKGDARTTKNSSSLHAFGYLTARMFNADVQFVANSGWGVKYGFNQTDANRGEENLSTAIKYVGIDTSQKIIRTEYDMSKFIPSIIIINAGGNDFSDYINNAGSDYNTAKQSFRDEVKAMCSYLIEQYPNATILWTHTKNSNNGKEATSAIAELSNSINQNIHTVEIKQVGEDNLPEGANAHAGLKTHIANADILANKITALTALKKQISNIVV